MTSPADGETTDGGAHADPVRIDRRLFLVNVPLVLGLVAASACGEEEATRSPGKIGPMILRNPEKGGGDSY